MTKDLLNLKLTYIHYLPITIKTAHKLYQCVFFNSTINY